MHCGSEEAFGAGWVPLESPEAASHGMSQEGAERLSSIENAN